MSAMKKLAIKCQNQLVNIVEFLSLQQDTEEPVSMFVSRLRGQAKVCQFSVQCPKDQCRSEVSYMDKMVSHQLVRGLVDSAVQERVLAEAATKQMDLKQIQEFVQAQESGAIAAASKVNFHDESPTSNQTSDCIDCESIF